MKVVGIQDVVDILSVDSLENVMNMTDYIGKQRYLEGSKLILFPSNKDYLQIIREWELDYTPCTSLCTGHGLAKYNILCDVSGCADDVEKYLSIELGRCIASEDLYKRLGDIQQLLEDYAGGDEIELVDIGLSCLGMYLCGIRADELLTDTGLKYLVDKFVEKAKVSMVSRIETLKGRTSDKQMESVLLGLHGVDTESIDCCKYFRNMEKQLEKTYKAVYEESKFDASSLMRLGQRAW